SLDRTRLVISNDGWEMTRTDICGVHNYAHGSTNEEKKYLYFKSSLEIKENILNSKSADRSIYADGFKNCGEPIILSECGEIAFDKENFNGWGYTSSNTEEEFLADYERMIDAIYFSECLFGFCYTQLTDVEQEVNGLLTYQRKPKCNLDLIKK
ncbi:MAG: glycoside hydrolase family 2, partial [Fusobacteriaceae bacterium]